MRTVVADAQTAPYLIDLTPPRFRQRLGEALSIYVEAMGYPRGTEQSRAPMWSEHLHRPGWRAVGALLPNPDPAQPDSLVAVAYGYHGAAHQWWHQQVRDGMRRAGHSPGQVEAVLGDYFELTELHVLPSAQGHGLGGRLCSRLLDGVTTDNVMLSTPEVAGEDNRAWRLYRRLGFTDVLRDFSFAGDRRPFAVWSRRLPLELPVA